LWWLIRTLGIGIGKAITLGEYARIKNENRRQGDYGILIGMLSNLVSKRSPGCGANEVSKDCPIGTVVNDFFQKGRTSDGTAPLRLFTFVGSDGQIINVQGYDLMQTVKVTVRRTDGTMNFEEVDPNDAMKWIRREARITP
jgi:hypothetical protein